MSRRYISLVLFAVLIFSADIIRAKGVETEVPTPATTVSSKEIENLPGNRSMQQILNLQPGQAGPTTGELIADKQLEKENLEQQITDMEQGLSGLANNTDSFSQGIRQDMQSTLNNAHSALADVNRDLSQLQDKAAKEHQEAPSQPPQGEQQAQIGEKTDPIESVLPDLGYKPRGLTDTFPRSRSSCGRDEYGYYDRHGYYDDVGYYDEDGYYWVNEYGYYDEYGYFDQDGYYDYPPPYASYPPKDSINWQGLGLGSYLRDQAVYTEGSRYTPRIDFKYKGGGMTQIDPPANSPLSGQAERNIDQAAGTKPSSQPYGLNYDLDWKITPRMGLEYNLGKDTRSLGAGYLNYSDQLGSSFGYSLGKTKFGFDNPSTFYPYSNDLTSTTPRRSDGFSSYGQQFGLGENLGWGGILVANGVFGKEPGVMGYDRMGAPVGSVTRQQATQDPQRTNDLINFAETKSQRGFYNDLQTLNQLSRDFKNELGQLGGQIDQREERIRYISPRINGFQPQIQFTPQSMASPRLGMDYGDIGTFAGGINQQLQNGITGPNFFQPFHCCSAMYWDEPVYPRYVLDETTNPNDPLYFKADKKPQAPKKKQSEKMTLIGSAIKMGGVSLGSGEASVRDKGPQIVDQWALQKVGFTPKSDPNSAWNVNDGQTKNVLVAIIDSGLDMTHPDVPQYIWTNPKEIPDNKIDDDNNGYVDDIHGWNFADENNDLTDLRGHGTNVAGIIAAKSNNALGIAGINPGAEIMVLKVTDKNGATNSLNIYRAMRYAVANGARVINVSLGAVGVSKFEQLTVNCAYRHGAIVIAAAGNDNKYISDYGPASLARVVSVGSLDYEGPRSLITNFGPNISILAPGDQIYTLHSKDAEWEGPPGERDRRFVKVSGTSFSAPIVTATASLILAQNPKLAVWQVEDILLSTASDMKEKGWDELTGAGYLNAAQALRKAEADVVNVKLTKIQVNRDEKKVQSVDVFGTVRGNVDHFIVELGKGSNPKWTKVVGPFKKPANNDWLCRIPQKAIQGSEAWQVRLTALDKEGRATIAQAAIPFEKNKR